MRDLASKILSRKDSNAAKAARKTDPAKPKITTGKVLKYMFLPDIGSRIRDIGKRFGSFAYFLAQIFYSCRLIPPGHPVLNPANIGYFGFSDVIATAASNLQMRKENTDQIVMFAGVIISMVLLIANGLAIAAYTVFDFGDAMAASDDLITGGGGGRTTDLITGGGGGTTASGSMFVAPNPNCDLALQFLDRVFGATNVSFFKATGACTNAAVHLDPSSIGNSAVKDALYAMLGIYSTAMMVIAMIIVIYYAFTIVGESAMTGQPFGKRFNSFWAPIRLVIGLGLLVPLAGGLNAAQYVTLYAAKLGSGLASYAWSGFITKMAATDLISDNIPAPAVSNLVYNIVRFETCRAVANEYKWFDDVVVNRQIAKDTDGKVTGIIYSWDRQRNAVGTVANLASAAVPGINVVTTFDPLGKNEPAACGEIFVPSIPQIKTISKGSNGVVSSQNIQKSLTAMQSSYQTAIEDVINSVRPKIESVVSSGSAIQEQPGVSATSQEMQAITDLNREQVNKTITAVDKTIKDFKATYKQEFKSQISKRISVFDNNGWMGAGMFYTQIADLNGVLVNTVSATFPRMTADITIPSEKEMKDADWFWGNGKTEGGKFDNETMRAMQKAIRNITTSFAQGANNETADARAWKKDWFSLFIIDLFGGEYIREFRNAPGNNPMADMSALGKGMMTHGFDYALWIMGLLAVGPLVQIGGLLLAASPVGIPMMVLGAVAGAAQAVAGFLIFAATIGIAIGAFLYYLIPLMPFVYFFFAAVSWVLDVIEAMVGLPLWALAHIRIDGDGLSGQAAQFGYTAIFGVIIRPFVILFGMIISIILFSAGMVMMRQMFGTYVGALGDGDTGSAIDYTAFSITYAVLAFSLASVCFKQSDQMTKSIMRWFGTSDPRYDDGQPDPTSNFQQVAFAGGAVASQMGSRVGEMAQTASRGASGMGKEIGTEIQRQ